MGCSDGFNTAPLVTSFNSRWDSWDAVATGAVDSTLTLLDGIADQFGGGVGAYATYTSPTLHNPVNISFAGIDVTAPTFDPPSPILNVEIDDVAPVSLNSDAFPDAPVAEPINIPTAPEVIDVNVPTSAPVVSDVMLPDVPVITLPDAPTFASLDLPTAPTIDLVPFEGSLPEMPPLPALGSFEYTEAAYSSELEQPLIDKILEWLLGGTGLPDHIWQAIWEKARQNEEETGAKLVQEAAEDFAARGFSLPPGALAGRVAEARQKVQDAANTLSRETAIQYAQMEVENIRFAVQQGITMEGQLKEFYNESARRALDVAKYTLEASISLLNATLTRFTAEVEAYKLSIDANNLLIQQELAKLDVYRAQLDAQRIIGDINRLEVDVYNANIQALLAEVQIYRVELDGVNALIEVDKTRIGAFTATVGAASEQIKAEALRYDAYSTQVGAEKTKAQIYEAQVRGYAASIDAVSAENAVLLANQTSAIQVQTMKLRRIETDARRFVAELGAEEAEIRAYGTQVSAEATVIQSQASVQEANVRADAELNRLKITDAKNLADIGVANATMFLQNAQVEAQLAVTTQQNVANTQAAIAASALSAVNMSSSLSAGQSESMGYTTSCDA